MSKIPPMNLEEATTSPADRWPELAHAFATALLQSSQPVPNGVGTTQGAPSYKRFNVYRNNVAVSLRAALATSYPVVKELVGEDFFNGMVQSYVTDRLPSSPVLLGYGQDFPEFIEDFPPAQKLPYLADVARLEWLFNESYNATDAPPINIEPLRALGTHALEKARLEFHPSLRLVKSDWPVMSIWHAHQQKNPDAHLPGLSKARSEHGFLVRPALDVQAMILPLEGFQLLVALYEGQTLTQAAGALPGAAQADLSTMLSTIFSAGTVTGLAAS